MFSRNWKGRIFLLPTRWATTRTAAVIVPDDDEDGLDEDIELDLSAGRWKKRMTRSLYLREMGVVLS